MHKKQHTFLIPNVTSAANIGDAAMLEVLISLIRTANPKAQIRIHSSEPDSYESANIAVSSNRPTLYFWTIFEKHAPFTRLYRLGLLLLSYIALCFNFTRLIKLISRFAPTLGVLLQEYLDATVIVFVGGGYLRSKKGVTQTLNLIMMLFPFALARFTRAKIVVAPISIGPFGYRWHEKLTAHVLRDYEHLAVREQFSFKHMQQYNLEGLTQSSDHALLVTAKKRSRKSKQFVVGFTIRPWLHAAGQKNLEAAYSDALIRLAAIPNVVIQPIVQVDAPQFGEGDGEVTERVCTALKKAGVSVLPTILITSVEHAKNVYGKINLLIGMRMHSNILAATQGTPFVAVSYEYKTEGIAADLGLEEFCLPCATLTSDSLFSTTVQLKNKHRAVGQKMTERLTTIQTQESKRWIQLFTA